MSFSGDPYRTLGLAPGATLDEIKRAYRRLAKQYHPDSAGPAALRRFLVIQGAYEALLRSRGADGRGGSGAAASGDGSSRTSRGGPADRRPWEADPERARSTRERYTERGGGRSRWERPKDGGNPAAGPASNARASNDAGTTAGAGPTSGDRTAGARGASSDGRTGGTGGPSSDGRTGGARDPSSRPSSPRARPGSTSYDGVDPEGRIPRWDGATWYGSASGTYWTVNPKEYADPRKHGPEYQQRGKRAASADGDREPSDGVAGEAPFDPARPGDFGGPYGADVGRVGSRDGRVGSRDGRGDRPDGDTLARDPGDQRGSGGSFAPRHGAAGDHAARAGTWPRRGAHASQGGGGFASGRSSSAYAAGRSSSAYAAGDASAAAGDDAAGAASHDTSAAANGGWSTAAPAVPAAATLLRHRRIALALLAWPPIGYVAAALVGELTGCARFSASCADPGGPAVILPALSIQVAILALLLAIPAIARPAAVATIGLLAASIPAAVLLDAFGGARAQGEAGALLIGLLAIAYGAGLAAAVAWPERLPEPFGRRTMGG